MIERILPSEVAVGQTFSDGPARGAHRNIPL
jgi:hypothetical protein